MKIAYLYRGNPALRTPMPPEIDHVVIEAPGDGNYGPEALAAVADVDAIYTAGCIVNAQLMAAAPNLKMVQTGGAGYEKLDLKEATRRGVICCNNGNLNSNRVADFSMMLVLTQMRRYVPTTELMQAGRWGEARDVGSQAVEVEGKTLGIIGFGNIGSRVAKRAYAFDMKIIYNDIRDDIDMEMVKATQARFVEKDELFRTADVITINTPLNDATRGMIDEGAISLMKPEAFLVCTARGNIIDEQALRQALDEGRLAGAGIDVFSTEPFDPSNPLLGAKNIAMSPHCAGRGKEGVIRSFNNAIENIRRCLVYDQQPHNVVN